ncbi:MAG: hypothetical protein ACI861_001046 [Paracoccaceae bacterium]|jgi:hypothetical protein
MFRNNVGPKDRVYRAVAAIILISSYFSAPEFALKWVILFSGLYLFFTAVMSTCAIYSVTGRNTNDEADAETEVEAEA